MSPKDATARYYDAWISRRGDMSNVPLAAEFKFRGPVADFDENGRIVRGELIYDAQELRAAMAATS